MAIFRQLFLGPQGSTKESVLSFLQIVGSSTGIPRFNRIFMDISDKKDVDYQTKRFCFEMLIFPTYSPFLSNQPKNHHQSNHKHPPTSRGKLRVQVKVLVKGVAALCLFLSLIAFNPFIGSHTQSVTHSPSHRSLPPFSLKSLLPGTETMCHR